jgi:hypothetical protein
VVYALAANGSFLKSTPLGFWRMCFAVVPIFDRFYAPPDFFNRLSVCSNDYAGKTRIEMLCKETCCIAPHLFPNLHLRREVPEAPTAGFHTTALRSSKFSVAHRKRLRKQSL